MRRSRPVARCCGGSPGRRDDEEKERHQSAVHPLAQVQRPPPPAIRTDSRAPPTASYDYASMFTQASAARAMASSTAAAPVSVGRITGSSSPRRHRPPPLRPCRRTCWPSRPGRSCWPRSRHAGRRFVAGHGGESFCGAGPGLCSPVLAGQPGQQGRRLGALAVLSKAGSGGAAWDSGRRSLSCGLFSEPEISVMEYAEAMCEPEPTVTTSPPPTATTWPALPTPTGSKPIGPGG
jgi:hypothetical protein